MIERFKVLIAGLAASVVLVCAAGGTALVADATALAADGWPWPVSGDVITPYINGSDPYAAGQHRGVDIASPVGATVRSSVAGDVTYAGHLPDGGITVTVHSSDGRYLVSYLHLNSTAVAKGDAVSAGSAVGAVGTTGKRSATQPHLHLGVRLASSGAYVDPLPLLGPRVVAQTPPAEAPAVSQPVQHAAPQARAKTDARTRSQMRTPQRVAQHHVARRRATTRSSQPLNVHAPSTGDSVSARSSHAAADSARESHASRGKGRVAPPPLPALAAASHPETVNLATPGRNQAGTVSASNNAGSWAPSSVPGYLVAVALLLAAAIAAFAMRRRGGRDDEFVPPLAHRADSVAQSSDDVADVVELSPLHRRA